MAQEQRVRKSELASLGWFAKWLLTLGIAAYAGFMIVSMYMKGDVAFPLLVLVVVGSGLFIFNAKRTYAHRYAYPAVAGMVTFIIFPMLYTLSIAFTNYSGDHTLDIEKAMKFHLDKVYRVPADQEGGGAYFFKLVIKPKVQGKTQAQIYLMKDDETHSLYVSDFFQLKGNEEFAKASENKTTLVNLNRWGGINDNECKNADGEFMTFDECTANMEGVATPKQINQEYKMALSLISLSLPDTSVRLQKTQMKKFEAVINKFDRVKLGAQINGINISDPHLLRDNETSKYFMPDHERGYYRYLDDSNAQLIGDDYVPGFKVGVGFANFKQILQDEGVRAPFIKIFIWTFIFAFLTVFFTLAIGMILACLVQWEFLKGRGIYRLFLVLPYAVPAFISILVFRGLFNESYGEINGLLNMIFPWLKDDPIGWFTSPMWAKSMILIVNTWLGYPYMMILCMGLLKSIPDELYEASAMDGASFVNNFFKITLPLLIKPLIPLLIASFAFNFNNFVLIQLLTNGAPDILDANPQAGETDLLVSYTYRIAFQGNGGQNYGLAAAIAAVIFLLVGFIAIIQLWATRRLSSDKPHA